ncbi:hypothetical protein P168DRAFT_276769 [Aspergillus campestris IBT 28561]|uniref:Uncharacterized protein n=1 Tax=Aspergillus campestris (strain IBT 28561) TaxID=1392248 RepID=A0A2I1CQN2_ASPC2|nr:uncharacterized protein P168DRAFT_276769 [Aspergillus campestris IBT 28561]PKX99922.1 hypothetical protein P168DRAFT_276769 [Aspergillus campestris IBT 28561]
MALSKAQTQSTETDIILNKANVALARSQRLVASWFPAPTAEEQQHTNVKSEEELQREEEEIFKAVPETLGIGAPLPSKASDGSWNRTELSSNDQLRRQLLGKNYKKVMAAKTSTTNGDGGVPGTLSDRLLSRGTADKQGQQQESDDDEEDGRIAAVGNRAGRGKGRGRKRGLEGSTPSTTPSTSTSVPGGGEDGEGVAGSGDGAESTQPSEPSSARPAPSGPKGRKKATSFLDEILADRSKKRKKR